LAIQTALSASSTPTWTWSPRRRVSVLRVLDPVELRLIPRLLRVFELPPLRGRVEARGRDPVAVGGGVIDERRPHRREGVDRVRRIFDQFRLGLDGALEQLVVEPSGTSAGGSRP